MGHLLKNAFQWKLRNFTCLFWPLVFPLLLATLFYFALGNIGQSETMQAVPVAVVDSGKCETAPIVNGFLEAVSEGENPVLKIENMTEEQARKALADQTVAGIIHVEEIPSLTVAGSGIQSSIVEMVLKMYAEHYEVIKNTAMQHPEKMADVVDSMMAEHHHLKTVSLGGKSLAFETQYYYALIAMACLYGGYMGLYAAMKIQANISPLAARRCITPTHKMQLVLSELLSCFALHMCNMLILLGVLRYLFRVPLGGNSGYTVLIAAFGVLIGVSFGFFIGAAFKCSEGLKIGMVTCISMVGSTCAGLMSPGVKFSIQRAVPLLNWLNPAAMISDSLYFVHIYDSPARMWQCLAVLGALSLILITASISVTRRERYAGI